MDAPAASPYMEKLSMPYILNTHQPPRACDIGEVWVTLTWSVQVLSPYDNFSLQYRKLGKTELLTNRLTDKKIQMLLAQKSFRGQKHKTVLDQCLLVQSILTKASTVLCT